MSKKHFFSVDATKPKISGIEGSKTVISASDVTSFNGISLEHVKLNKGYAEEPHWHPNAHKIGYCLKGNALVTIHTPHSHESFTVTRGEVFFIPKGNFHFITNCGDSECMIVSALSHASPEELTLSKALHSLSDSVFASTFQTPASFFDGIKKSQDSKPFIKYTVKKPPSDISSHFKFNIETSNTYLTTKGGYLKAATRQNLPVIEDLGIFGFGLNIKGIVEPHWHTNAGELVYVAKGHVRISILSADGSHDVSDAKAGEGAFAPASYFHSIENLGNEDAEIVAFFTASDPDYIGIGQATSLCSSDVLAATFNLPVNYFEAFKAPSAALVIAGG